MKMMYEGKEMNFLTVKELYEACKVMGKENAIIGVHHYNDDIDGDGHEYEMCEPITQGDIDIGGLFETAPRKRVADAVWLDIIQRG